MLRIEVTRGPDRGKVEDLGTDRIVIGTHEACDFVVTDPTASRQHCEIALVDAGYRVRDLSSLNGTRVQGLWLGEVTLDQKAQVQVGSTVLQLTPLAQTIDVPLADRTSFGPLLGRSAAMRRVFEVFERVAPTPATVLIMGESGTGKEVAARALHQASTRAKGPFVVVDCGALPSNLIESTLYGHVRGAFTGADRARVGAFEAATGGTLFLDEIGELPLELQTRLLGVIERRQVQPVGSATTRDIDVRLLAATNRDLRRDVNRGTFRADLFFRLAVVTVTMPALRDRPDDIPLYVDAFLAEWASAGQPFSIAPSTVEELAKRPWRGNVRELRNTLERAAALGEVDTSGPAPGEHDSELAVSVDPAIPFKTAKASLIEGFERRYVESLMEAHDANITRAARAAEIDRVYLLRLLDKFGLRPTKRGKKK